MRSQTDSILAALLRAQRFAADYSAELTGTVDLTVARQRLDTVITNLSTHGVEQDANRRSAKGETEKQRQIRLTLRTEQMRPIAEIARRDLRTVPEFKALQLPPRSAKGAAFVASATAMANAASSYEDALLKRGLPADFLEQFQALLTQFEQSVSTRDSNRSRRIGATKALTFEEQEGRSVLKVLDALVRRALGDNTALLGTWEGASTVHYRGRKAAAPATTTGTTPVAQPATTATPVATTPATQPVTNAA